MRSIATGEGIFPLGGLAFAVMETGRDVEQSFFVLGHDIGSAIKTAARADVFFGIGKDALQKAENFNTPGKLYYLLKR
jgi:membrane-bound lytic murein transglycosylase A